VTSKKTLLLIAKTEEQRQSWVSELRELVYGLAQKVVVQESRGMLGGALTIRANATMSKSSHSMTSKAHNLPSLILFDLQQNKTP